MTIQHIHSRLIQYLILIFTGFFVSSFSLKKKHDGIYILQNKTGGYSILKLNENQFHYISEIGGCHSELSGNWSINTETNTLHFENDYEYTNTFLENQKNELLDSAKENYKVHKDSSLYELDKNIANNYLPCYPNLNKGCLKFKKKGIKFKKEIDCSCTTSKGLYIKHD